MADERTINLLIKAAVDQNASQAAIRQLEAVKQDLLDVQKATSAADPAFQNLANNIQAIGKNNEIQKVASDLRDAQREADALSGKLGGALGMGGGGGAAQLPMSGARGLRYGGMLLNQISPGSGTGLMMAGELEGFLAVLQQIGPAAIPAAAGLGLLAVGIANFQNTLKESEGLLHSALTSLDAYYKAIATGTQTTIQAQIDLLKVQAKIDDDKVKQLQGDVARGRGQAFKLGYGAGGIEGGTAALGIYDLTSGAKELQKALDDAQAAAKKSHAELDGLNRAMNNQSVIARTLTEDMEKLGDKMGKTLVEIAKNNETIQKMDADQAIKEKRQKEAEQRLAERQIVEDAYRTQIAYEKQQESMAKARENAADKERDALTKFNNQSLAVDHDYMNKALKAVADYNEREDQLVGKHNRQRLRDVQDAQDKLRSLAAAGDVAAFVEERKSLQKKLTRDDEDFSEEEKQRRKELDRNLQDIETQRQERQAALQVAYDQEKAIRAQQLQDRLQEIEDSGKASNAKSAQLEQELNRIREQWRREDLDRQHQMEQDDFTQRRNAYVQHGAELVDIVRNQFTQMGNDARQLLMLSNGGSAGPQSNFFTNLGGFVNGIFGNSGGSASFGSYDAATAAAIFGDGGGSASFGSYDATTAAAIYGNSASPTIVINNTVGDVATQSQLDNYQQTTIEGVRAAMRINSGRGDF